MLSSLFLPSVKRPWPGRVTTWKAHRAHIKSKPNGNDITSASCERERLQYSLMAMVERNAYLDIPRLSHLLSPGWYARLVRVDQIPHRSSEPWLEDDAGQCQQGKLGVVPVATYEKERKRGMVKKEADVRIRNNFVIIQGLITPPHFAMMESERNEKW